MCQVTHHKKKVQCTLRGVLMKVDASPNTQHCYTIERERKLDYKILTYALKITAISYH